jgi:outer membrane lipoprotein-sorting protein
LSAAAICKKVAETYRTLRVYQLVAQQSFDVPGFPEVIYTLAMVKPDKIRLTLKNAPPQAWEQRQRSPFEASYSSNELMIVSDGDTTWRYSAKTRKYTREQSAVAVDDADDEPPLSRLDLLTTAQNTLLSQFIRLPINAAAARIARIDQIKIAGAKIDCYVLQFRRPESSNELWIDKQRFLVLRQIQKWNSSPTQTKMTLNLKQVDISNTPESDLFTFTPPEKAIQVQTLNLPGEQPDLSGRAATDFSLRSLESGNVTLSELRGKGSATRFLGDLV